MKVYYNVKINNNSSCCSCEPSCPETQHTAIEILIDLELELEPKDKETRIGQDSSFKLITTVVTQHDNIQVILTVDMMVDHLDC
jgi:hypothetical protein